MIRGNKAIAAVAAIVLLILTWGAVLIVGIFFEPSLALWAGIVTAAALATEGALWIGAGIAGIAVFQRIRNRLRFRR